MSGKQDQETLGLRLACHAPTVNKLSCSSFDVRVPRDLALMTESWAKGTLSKMTNNSTV